MAVITTTLTPTPARFPYINPYGPPEVWATGIPREELIFTALGEAIAVATGGNTQRLVVNMNLPAQDAYVLVEASLALSGADNDEWNVQGFSRLISERTGAALWAIMFPFPGIEVPEGASAGRKIYSSGVSNKVLLTKHPDGGQLVFKTDNNTADGSVMSFEIFARFLVFDRIQAQNYNVNSPVPTR